MNLRTARRNQRISQNDLAKIAGIVARSLSLVENERLIPRDFEKKRIADALSLSVGDITWPGACEGGVRIIPKDKDDPQEDATVDPGAKDLGANLGAIIGKAISDHLESQSR